MHSKSLAMSHSNSSAQAPSAWSYTIQDFITSLDRLYHICDASKSSKQCIEVIQQMNKSLSDFENLKERILMSKRKQRASQGASSRNGGGTHTQKKVSVSASRRSSSSSTISDSLPSQGRSSSKRALPEKVTWAEKIERSLTQTDASESSSSVVVQQDSHDSSTTSPMGKKSRSRAQKRQSVIVSPGSSFSAGAFQNRMNNAAKELPEVGTSDGSPGVEFTLNAETVDFSEEQNSATDVFEIDLSNPNFFPLEGQSWYDVSKTPSPSRKKMERISERLTSPARSKVNYQTLNHKQEKAKLNREQHKRKKTEGARKSTERVRAAMQRREEQKQQLLRATEEKHKRAEENARIYVETISENAKMENQKVDEFKLYNQMKQETLMEQTNSKLNSSESRRKMQFQSKKEKLEESKLREKEAKEKRQKLQQQKQKVHQEKEQTRKAAEARREENEKKELELLSQRNAEKAAKVQETNKKMQLKQEQKKKQYIEKLEISEKRKNEQLQNIKQRAVAVSERVKEVKTRKTTSDADTVDDNLSAKKKLSSSKRTKKIKNRLTKSKQSAETYIQQLEAVDDNTKVNPSLKRLLQELKLQIQSKRHVAVTSQIHELIRFLDRKPEELEHLRCEGIFEILIQVIQKNDQKFPVAVASKFLSKLCTSIENISYIVISLQILPLVQTLRDALVENRATQLPHLLSIFIAGIRNTHIPDNVELEKEFKRDLISMFAALGGLEETMLLLTRYIQSTQLGLSSAIPPMIHKAAYLLQSTAECIVSLRDLESKPVFEKSSAAIGPEESIVSVLTKSVVVELLPLLAHLLLKQGPSRGENFQQSVSPSILNLCLAVFKFLNNYACINFRGFQKHMGTLEANSPKHVLAFLLEYCNRDMDIKPGTIPESRDPPRSSSKADIELRLLNEVVLFVGYFAHDNCENQKVLQYSSGKGNNNIIQFLCGLPIQYFADENFKTVLVPTLIAVSNESEDNVTILSQEMSLETLVTSLEKYSTGQEEIETDSTTDEGKKHNLRDAYLPQNRIIISEEVITFFKKHVPQ
uniref:S phase cyclin A-associated protein in the endoplasmic reticulum N-terminal domain-containing protein n=1 Tax=Percolomonas cosmopolitus TaxID=63605 RepID=A0A7S1PHR9_9EUKA|mmetsp:Transcript_6176/g.23353  ORF Transcript_6176/g.23353 Transcript_6176/m.23353 type:complete len:1041 (+) Transcript_6176:315-3437(+)